MKSATIVTSKGTLTLELYDKEAPGTVANFEKLANSGFYDGTNPTDVDRAIGDIARLLGR